MEELNNYQKKYLSEIKKLQVREPYFPWRFHMFIEMEGIFACGWTENDNLLIISVDEHKTVDLSNPAAANLDYTRGSYDHMSKDNLLFEVKTLKEQVPIVGIYGGMGNLVSSDGWKLNILHPYWPNSVVSLSKSKIETLSTEPWLNLRLIKLNHLNYNNLNCGFSLDETYFFILGTTGIEVFSRR